MAPTSIVGWLEQIRVCCVFACPSKLTDDDPLPAMHAARLLHLHCGWVGTVAAYAAHLEVCGPASCLRRWSMDPPPEADSRETWKTGDFCTCAAWRSVESWGDEAALCVEAGESLYVSEVDEQGWAKGALPDGRCGWLPFSVCERRVHVARRTFDGQVENGYRPVEFGDRVVVYHREANWAYGSILVEAGPGTSGWFPAAVVEAL